MGCISIQKMLHMDIMFEQKNTRIVHGEQYLALSNLLSPSYYIIVTKMDFVKSDSGILTTAERDINNS